MNGGRVAALRRGVRRVSSMCSRPKRRRLAEDPLLVGVVVAHPDLHRRAVVDDAGVEVEAGVCG